MNSEQHEIDREEFIDRFGDLYEDSPWIAAEVFDSGDGLLPGLDELHNSFRNVVMSASFEQQLDLLNAHPQLGLAQAEQSTLTESSREEQSSVGLDHCSEEELFEFGQLNQHYRDQFGFPFIMAVQGWEVEEILAVFHERLGNEPGDEFTEAIRQVCRIGRLRLEALFDE